MSIQSTIDALIATFMANSTASPRIHISRTTWRAWGAELDGQVPELNPKRFEYRGIPVVVIEDASA